MHFSDRRVMASLDVQMDAFFRALCPECGATPLYVDRTTNTVESHGAIVSCRKCGYLEQHPARAYVASWMTCAVCCAFAVRVSQHHPRCAICQAKWDDAGRPPQRLTVYNFLSFAVDWGTIPQLDLDGLVDAAIAIRKATPNEVDRTASK